MSKISHTNSINGQLISKSSNPKLRTILKSRNGSILQNQHRSSSFSNHNDRYDTFSSLSNQSVIEKLQLINQREILNCEQDLIIRRKSNYQQIKEKLSAINCKAQELIHKKLARISKKQHSMSLKNKGKDQLTEGLEQIIRQIKELKIQQVRLQLTEKQQLKQLITHKISILEKLMAEKNTQGEILKKYYYAISTNNHKNKYKLKKQKIVISRPHKLVENNPPKKYFHDGTLSKFSFQTPEVQDYERYRHQTSEYKANNQPFPRSSYKRDFLSYNYHNKTEICPRYDSPSIFSLKRPVELSTYSKQFRNISAQRINYKDLDSYRNKIKTLPISFYDLKTKKELPEMHALWKDQVKEKGTRITPLKNIQHKDRAPQPNNPLLITQAKRQYTGSWNNKRSIKNKALNTLKYAYRKHAYN